MDTTEATTVADAPLSEDELDEVYGGARAEIVPCSSTDCCVEQ